MANVILNVPDISCEHCERAIKGALEPITGVQSVNVDIPARTVKVQAYNLKGQLVEKVVSDLESRAWQHEIDHLNGVLFIDMMGPIAKLASRGAVKCFERDFRRMQERGEIPRDADIEKVLAAIEGRVA